MVLSLTLVLCHAPAVTESWRCRLLSCCVRLQPALCRGVFVYSRVVSGSSRLCALMLSFILVLRPAPAGSVSWYSRLLSFCGQLQPALCRGAVIYSRVVSGASQLSVAALSLSLVCCPALCCGMVV